MAEDSRSSSFRILDAMILIAAAATAIVLTRSYLRCYPVMGEVAAGEPSYARAMGTRQWIYAAMPSLLLLSLALWPLRVTRRGGRSRRAIRLPGLAVSYAAWVAIVLALARTPFDWKKSFRNMYHGDVGLVTLDDVFTLRLITMKDFMGAAVALTWLILNLGRGWRAEPGWIDRTGRALGVIWIALGLGFWVAHVLTR